jgi:hypothetical protein
MKPTERINRINESLDQHFKSNKNAWWVSNSIGDKSMILLHRGYGGYRIRPIWVALHILRTEPSVKTVLYEGMCVAYTRTTLGWAGYKFKSGAGR